MHTGEHPRRRPRALAARLAAVVALVAAGVVVPAAPGRADPLYPSNDCALGTSVVEGFVGDTHVLVRTAPGGPSATWVCVAVDDGVTHVGGKVVVDTATPATPDVDDEQAECAADPDNERLRDMEIGPDEEPLIIDLTQRSDEVWVCVQATTQVAKRVMVPVDTGGSTFLPDAVVPFPYVEAPAPVGQDSSACQNALTGRTRLVNLDVSGTHLWAYAWQESASKSHACVRVEGADAAGGRLDLDTAGGQTFVTPDTSSDFTPCPVPVVTDSGTPPYGVFISDPLEGSPAWACVQVDGVFARVMLDADGDQAVVDFAEDG